MCDLSALPATMGTMTAPVDTTGDVVLIAELTVPAEHWRDAATNAELRLVLEEDLGAQARGRGRELRDDRGVQLVWLKRHTWRDLEDGREREWRQHATPAEADLVEVIATARAYRP